MGEVALAYYEILKAGGFTDGGTNFDAKLRRQSLDPDDLLVAHVGAMDICARALKAAARMLQDGVLEDFISQRYASWQDGLGAQILDGNLSLDQLGDLVRKDDINPQPRSGKQEYLENIVNRYV